MPVQKKILSCLFTLILMAAGASGNQSLSATLTISPSDSITRAIETAEEGDTIEVLGGVYKERIVIDKSIKVIGINSPVIDGRGEGTVVLIKAPDSTFKGFHIRGSGTSLTTEDAGIILDSAENNIIEDNHLEDVLFGIYLKNSPGSLIRNNFIKGKELPLPERGDGIRLWYSSGTRIENNQIIGTRDLVMWWSSNTLIKGNKVEKGRYGLHYMYSNDNRFENNIFSENFVGGFLMYSSGIKFYHNIFINNQGPATGYGIGFKDLDDVIARENLFINNRVGIYLDNSPHLIDSWNNINKNVIAFNDIGISLMPSIERNVFSGNSFIENTEQVEVRGGGTLMGNKWYENEKGNYWSDYVGYDENGDRVGDIPYSVESLFENLIDRYPNLRIFIFSPASQAIELASKVFPVIKPEPKIVDNYPLIDPRIPDNFKNEEKNFSFKLLITSLFLILIPLGLYAYLAKPKKRYLDD